MSLLGEIMQDTRGIVNEVLGHACMLTNTSTGESTSVLVIINQKIELYQDGIFAGLVTTATFDRTQCDPMIGDSLQDLETGIHYDLEALKDENETKRVFIVGEK